MLKQTIMASGLLIGFAAPAFADCASDISKVEQALATAQVSDAEKMAIQETLDKAKTAGDPAACEATLADIKQALNME